MPPTTNVSNDHRPVAVVTGASSGIGAATARRLAAEGYRVVCAARRRSRLDELAAEINGEAITLDVTSSDSVAALATAVPRCSLLVNDAGGALGLDPIATADPDEWQTMYDVNVLGVLRVTQALLPALIASGAGHVIVVGSTAGHIVYEGGAGYTAAKHAVTALAETLRLELCGQPVRVTEIAPLNAPRWPATTWRSSCATGVAGSTSRRCRSTGSACGAASSTACSVTAARPRSAPRPAAAPRCGCG